MSIITTFDRPLSKRLAEWCNEGLITSEQVNGIVQYEARRPGSNWLIFSILSLAATVIGIGILSLVAVNWHLISDEVKLIVDFGLLFALAVGVLRLDEESQLLGRELLLVLFMVGCLASIGLIAQIYHTGGRLTDALLFWCAIIFPAATLSQRPFPAWLWSSILLGSLLFWYGTGSFWFGLAWSEEVRWLEILFALPFLTASVAMLLRAFPQAVHFRAAFRSWSLVATLVGVQVIDGIGSYEMFDPEMVPQALIAGFFSGIVLLTVILMHRAVPNWHKLLAAVGFGLYLLFFPVVLLTQPGAWLCALFSILLYLCGALYTGHIQQRHWSHFLVLLAGFRFLGVYFQLIGGFALTGLGLIFSGLMILTFLWIWHKNRHRLASWMESFS